MKKIIYMIFAMMLLASCECECGDPNCKCGCQSEQNKEKRAQQAQHAQHDQKPGDLVPIKQEKTAYADDYVVTVQTVDGHSVVMIRWERSSNFQVIHDPMICKHKDCEALRKRLTVGSFAQDLLNPYSY